MLYFVYCADRPGTLALRDELVEAHWAYMDGFAAGMIARGPTMTGDRSAPTGSLHIVDLPSDEAARAFAEEEPNWRAGVYESVTMYRYEDLLGRTMWDFPGPDGDRFLVTALSPDPAVAVALPSESGAVIAFGRLTALGDGRPAGVAACVQALDPEAAAAVVAAPQGAAVTVQPWQFGGRR